MQRLGAARRRRRIQTLPEDVDGPEIEAAELLECYWKVVVLAVVELALGSVESVTWKISLPNVGFQFEAGRRGAGGDGVGHMSNGALAWRGRWKLGGREVALAQPPAFLLNRLSVLHQWPGVCCAAATDAGSAASATRWRANGAATRSTRAAVGDGAGLKETGVL